MPVGELDERQLASRDATGLLSHKRTDLLATLRQRALYAIRDLRIFCALMTLVTLGGILLGMLIAAPTRSLESVLLYGLCGGLVASSTLLAVHLAPGWLGRVFNIRDEALRLHRRLRIARADFYRSASITEEISVFLARHF